MRQTAPQLSWGHTPRLPPGPSRSVGGIAPARLSRRLHAPPLLSPGRLPGSCAGTSKELFAQTQSGPLHTVPAAVLGVSEPPLALTSLACIPRAVLEVRSAFLSRVCPDHRVRQLLLQPLCPAMRPLAVPSGVRKPPLQGLDLLCRVLGISAGLLSLQTIPDHVGLHRAAMFCCLSDQQAVWYL